MGYPTKIEYATATWSPWFGCRKVSPGCEYCFGEAWAKRSGMAQWGNAPRVKAKNWKEPLKWDRIAAGSGKQFRVLTDLCDPFDNRAPDEWRREYFDLIFRTQNLNWLVLTKRVIDAKLWAISGLTLPSNVWLGVTVCNQEEADRDIPILLSIPANKHWISYEPALGPIDFRFSAFNGTDSLNSLAGIDWIVAGCSSAIKQQPANEEWFWDLLDQCDDAHVPCYLKQMVDINGVLVKKPALAGKQRLEIPQ